MDSLYGRYKLYKSGTEKVIRWLVEASASLQAHPNTTQTGTKKSENRVHTKTTPPIRIHFKELVLHAKSIASADPPRGIPFSIIDVIKEVITGRKICAEWYASESSKDGSDLAKENDFHTHFIQVLKKVRNILTAAISGWAKSTTKLKAATSRLTQATGSMG